MEPVTALSWRDQLKQHVKQHLHLYIVAIIPAAVSLYIFWAKSDKVALISPIPNLKGFIHVDKNDNVVILYNLDARNNSAEVSGAIIAVSAELTHPSENSSTFRQSFSCASTIEHSKKVDFNTIEILPKSSAMKAVLFARDTVNQKIVSPRSLVAGEYILLVSTQIFRQTRPSTLRYKFSLTDCDIKAIYKMSNTKHWGDPHAYVPVHFILDN